MINFKDRAFIVPSALILLSILIMAGTLMYMVFVPAPTVNGLARGRTAKLQEMTNEINSAKLRTAQAQQQIRPLVWTGGPDTISGAVLEQLTSQARQHSLSISAFRPQRIQDVGGVTELPYTVQLSGAYDGIRAVMASLDAPSSKVVLRSAQIGSAATGSGVTATLGLTAYILTAPPTDPAARKTAPATPKAAPAAAKAGQHG